MSKQKHTPGPWYKMPYPTKGGGFNVRDKSNNVPSIARTYNDDGANARLIAAAPDLLEAAKRIDAWMAERGDMMGSQTAEVRDFVRAAIERAEGGA